MRPIFVIYLAAGVTLFFAVMNFAASVGYACVTHHAIVLLKPTGDDLDNMQAAQSHYLELAAEWFTLVFTQAVIIISARRFQKHAMTPNN
jgi:hypothetical protein